MKELHKQNVKGCAEYHKPKQRQPPIEHILYWRFFVAKIILICYNKLNFF